MFNTGKFSVRNVYRYVLCLVCMMVWRVYESMVLEVTTCLVQGTLKVTSHERVIEGAKDLYKGHINEWGRFRGIIMC